MRQLSARRAIQALRWINAGPGTAALAGWAVRLPFALLLAQMSTGAMGGGVVSALVLHAMLITASGQRPSVWRMSRAPAR